MSVSYAIGDSEPVTEFAHPQPGSWLSRFSKENILPQVQSASQTATEKQVIEGFIRGLESAPKGAHIVGYNIKNFDIPFLRGRAREYGLEEDLLASIKGKRQIDVGLRTKMIVAGAIDEHIQRGTFTEQLGGKTWGQAQVAYERLPYAQRPPEYRMLKQMESFAKEAYQPESVANKQVRGWKLEQIFPLIDSDFDLARKAHQSSADVLMTKRLFEAVGTGELEAKARTPEFAQAWLRSTVEGLQNAPSPAQKAAGEIYNPTLKSKLSTTWSRLPQASRRLIGGTALFMSGLAATSALVSIFEDEDIGGEQRIEGLSHRGIAQIIRRQLTDFSSPVNLAKATARAQELYKSKISQLLGNRKLTWMDVVDDGEVTLLAKDADSGEALMGISREFMKGEVHLTSVEVSRSLRGEGIGKQFYKAEADILRELGFDAGTKITSPVSSPITARWQMQQYGSTIDAQHGARLGNLDEWQQRILTKSVTREEMPGITMTGTLGYRPPAQHKPPVQHNTSNPTRQGVDLRHTALRARQIETTPVSGKKTAHNKIQGKSESGIGAWLRKKISDFGSPVDLLKATQRASKMYESSISDILKFAGMRKKEFKISSFISSGDGHHSLTVKAFDLEGNEIAGIARRFSPTEIELQSINMAESIRGIGAGRLIYEKEIDIFREIGYKAGEQVVSPSVISPITARMQMQMYGAKIQGGFFDDAAEMTQQIMSKQMDTSSFMHVELVGKIPPAPGAAMAVGSAGAIANKMVKMEQVKMSRVARGELTRAASATISRAGRDGGRRSRIG